MPSARLEATYNNADVVVHDAEKIQEHFLAQDDVVVELP
jgi:hypothetical protein